MIFDVYCDESSPDALTSKSPNVKYMLIGSLWLPFNKRHELKEALLKIREKHSTWGEIKWSKVSQSKIEFYKDLIDLFWLYNDDLRFRAIVVNQELIQSKLMDDDAELGFYKFYYQLIHHWIQDNNEYNIFCDVKVNRDRNRIKVLERCLSRTNLSSTIKGVQSLPSKEVVLIQYCDFLLGLAGAKLNKTLNVNSAKNKLVLHLEQKLGHTIQPTYRTENKFNIFKIRLQGGW